MSFGGPFNLYDPVVNSFGRVSPQNRLIATDPTRLIGPTFAGTITTAGGPPKTGTDTYFWYLANAGGASQTGAASISSNLGSISIPSGSAANDWSLIRSVRKARLVSGQMNAFVGVAKLSATSATSAKTYFGPFTPVDNTGAPSTGHCFCIEADGTVRVQAYEGGTANLNLSSGFNGTLGSTYSITNINYHRFEIIYFYWQVVYMIDNQVLHKATIADNVFSPTQTNNICASMVGTAAAETNGRTFTIAFMMAERYGQPSTRPQNAYLNAAATTVLKTGPGTLHGIVIGNPANSQTITFYDNTAASGTIIAVLTLVEGLPYAINFGSSGLDFSVGLTAVLSSTNAVTVLFD